MDDTLTFMKNEVKRNKKYHGLIFDPPSFGRGKNKQQTWKLDRDLPELLSLIPSLLTENPLFVILSCHDPDLDADKLRLMLKNSIKTTKYRGTFDSGDLFVHTEEGKPALKMGYYARWSTV